MSDGEVHALLSPSRADRYMACAGSVALEAAYPDEGSVYADEGSAAHLLASWCLKDKTDASDYLGETIRIGKHAFVVDTTMAGYVADYVKLVREYAAGKTLLVEQRVPIGHLTGETGAEGTSDAIILDTLNNHLTVVDLKYGMGVEVSAQENPQLLKYALGSLEHCDMLGTFDKVSMVIHMPRRNFVSEWMDVPLPVLNMFAEEVRASADRVRAAVREYDDPGVDQRQWENEYLRPGEKQCRFCKAKSGCKALAREVSELVGEAATAADFADLVVSDVVAETGDNFLSDAMAKVGLVEDWCKAVRAEVERRLLDGKDVAGFKLVEGRAGPRKWADEVAAEALLKRVRLKQGEMYERKLVSPTTAEKLLKKTKPKVWDEAQAFITRADGKPSVAPATDPRPALVVANLADEFSELARSE